MSAVAPLPHLMSEAEVAEYLGVDAQTIARLRRAGRLGFLRIGRKIRISEKHVARYLEAAECGSTSATISPTGPAPTTSVGQTSLDAHAADLLAREITRPRRRRSRGSSSSSTSPATSG
jgi:excisionase family DNA binding protein